MRFLNWRGSAGDATSVARPPRPPLGPRAAPSQMPHAAPFCPRLAPVLAAGLALILGPGCEHKQVDQMTQAVESGERPVAMAGSEAFMGGRVVARVTVSRGIGRGYKHVKAGLIHGGTAFDATQTLADQDRENEVEAKEAYEDYAKARAVIGTPLPPVTLHLILINPGAAPVTVTVADFESDLGNFVVFPETLTVPAGDSSEPTAMVSQLGVSSDVIPVTVTLKVAGTRETRVIQVRNLLDAGGKPRAPSN